jgi:capsular exopolysaccharide synthesis family protein
MESNLPQSLDEYVAVFSKRRKHFIVPFLIAAVLTAGAYPFVPKFYQAKALVMVSDDDIIAAPGSRNGRGRGGVDVEKTLRSVYVEMMEPDTMAHLANLLGEGDQYANNPKGLRSFVARVRRHMEINTQPTGVVEIGYTSDDPSWAAKSANALAELMVWIDRKSRQEESEKSIRFIEQQLRIYKGRIQDSEKSFFVNKTNSDIDDALRRRSALLDQIDQYEKATPAVVRDQSPSVYKMQSELSEARARLSQLSLTAREDSPMVRDLRKQVTELETAIAHEKEASAPDTPTASASSNPQYAGAVRELRNVNNEIAFLRRKQTNLEQGVAYVSEDELSAKQNEQNVNQDIYKDLLEQLEQAQLNLRLATFGEGGNVKVLEEAEKPLMPSWPLPWQALGFGVFLAFGAGAASVLIREMTDSSLRGVEDAQRAFKLPILAAIPDLYPTKSNVEAASAGEMSPQMVTLHNPQSLAAEHYRLLRTRILFITQKRPIQTLMFSSAMAGEGKTTTSCNMAISMANELDKKIALVDCDLRQSSVSRYLAIPQGKGLHEYLNDEVNISGILKPTRLERLTVITAGQPVENPSKLLTSPKMAELMRDLRERFDFIILDAAPLVPLADVPILLSHVDGLALVAHVGTTPKKFIRQAITTIENAQRAPLLGLVLTRAENTLPTYVNQYFVSGSAKRTRRT